MDDNITKASPEYRKICQGFLIVSAVELNRLIRENLALKKEIRLVGDLSVPCDHCKHNKDNLGDCTGNCGECEIAEGCPCRNCGAASESFEWRGVVKENAPTLAEETALQQKLVARERE